LEAGCPRKGTHRKPPEDLVRLLDELLRPLTTASRPGVTKHPARRSRCRPHRRRLARTCVDSSPETEWRARVVSRVVETRRRETGPTTRRLDGVEIQVELTRHETTQRRGGHGPMYEEQVTPALAGDWPGARVREGKAHDSKSIVAGGRDAVCPASRPLRPLHHDLDLGAPESSAAFLDPRLHQVARVYVVGETYVV